MPQRQDHQGIRVPEEWLVQEARRKRREPQLPLSIQSTGLYFSTGAQVVSQQH